jgi:hypothetical protein
MSDGRLKFGHLSWDPARHPFESALAMAATEAEHAELARLKELACAGRLVRVAPEGCEAQYVVRKAAPDVRAIDEDKRRVTVVASDATLDRYGDTIAADGWKTANFEKNPVVLLDHWYVVEYIVGQCAKWWVEGGQFLNEHAFDPAGTNAKADMAWQKILNRSLRAVSVGFRALKWAKRLNEQNEWTGGFDFLEQELLEVSWVAVPANPSAVIPASISLPPTSPAKGHLDATLQQIREKATAAEILSRLG